MDAPVFCFRELFLNGLSGASRLFLKAFDQVVERAPDITQQFESVRRFVSKLSQSYCCGAGKVDEIQMCFLE
jgi:hypothetical protein